MSAMSFCTGIAIVHGSYTPCGNAEWVRTEHWLRGDTSGNGWSSSSSPASHPNFYQGEMAYEKHPLARESVGQPFEWHCVTCFLESRCDGVGA